MELSRFYWIEHNNKTGNASSAKVPRSVTAHKKEGVDVPKRWEDYVLDDSALYAIKDIRVEKYADGVRVAEGSVDVRSVAMKMFW